ncbi:uncharacterized protein LOC130635627 [Hydractinia symbiolongicarpus]|uniref:uncharacterized protein LOC130635627 n=1 Tax=Hydractinia symbiolongicarpus TaxID=13093 RepID=UPI00254DDB93|nr:uncharacterized protein LOC130635627 [Hydractinia symbiolongicarpus]
MTLENTLKWKHLSQKISESVLTTFPRPGHSHETSNKKQLKFYILVVLSVLSFIIIILLFIYLSRRNFLRENEEQQQNVTYTSLSDLFVTPTYEEIPVHSTENSWIGYELSPTVVEESTKFIPHYELIDQRLLVPPANS